MKKILNLVIALFMCLIFTQNAHAGFVDMDETNWAYPYVTYLEEKGVVFGYPDGEFRPDDLVTKAEFTSMATRALGLIGKPIEQTYEWLDVTPDFWGYPYIQLAANYDLVEEDPDGYFNPNDNVKRVEVIEVITNALNISELTPEAAKEYLAEFEDADEVPSWALLRTAKAKQLDMLIIPPYDEGFISPLRPATRGELAGFLVAMMERAAIAPNHKIAGQPKIMDGYVLENVYLDKDIAYIPAGTILPLAVMDCMSSKKPFDDSRVAVVGESFTARATKNFVDKNKVLIIPVGARFEGTVQKVVKEKTLLKNGEIVLATDTMIRANTIDETTEFPAVADIKAVFKHPKNSNTWKMNDFLNKIAYYIFKGQNAWVHKGQIKEFILLKPVQIDVMTNWVKQ
ncbi:MAG: S-layer homology domain-containing protein [Cyanobacteria bacterium SIG30]|nr:S-layer homology domain-containing protein [Cyanobacteria bacterium SIG30]